MPPLEAARVLVEYYAHSCFVLSSGKVRLLIDPYSEQTGYKQPMRGAQLTLVSHDHFDHNHVAGVVGRTTVVRGAAERELEGVRIRGVVGEHGGGLGPVTCFCLEMEGLTICHLSDLGPSLPAGLGAVDLLMVPVGGGGYTMGPREALAAVTQLKPRWVLPMHYRTPFLNRAAFPELEPLDNFLRQTGRVQKPGQSSVELTAQTPGAGDVIALAHMF